MPSALTATASAAGAQDAAHRMTVSFLAAGLSPWRINEKGLVLGITVDDPTYGYTHAFLWRDGTMTNIDGIPGALTSAGVAINDRGQVAGVSGFATGSHSFLWDNGVVTDLESPAYDYYVTARDINNSGQIVGVAGAAGGSSHAFLWQRGVMSDLGTLPGGTWASAEAINDGGQVVGASHPGSSYASYMSHATVWQHGTAIDLTPDADHQTVAFDINNAGQIVGVDGFNTDDFRAVMFENGSMVELTVPGYTGASSPFAINERGQVLLEAWSNDFELYGSFLWDHGKTTNLTVLTDGLVFGQFNNHGQFLGGENVSLGRGVVMTIHGEMPGS